MKISILAFGEFDNSAEKTIFDEFLKRIKGKVELKELNVKNSKNLNVEELKTKEAELINNNLQKNQTIITLDENGLELTSIEFAKIINKFHINGNSNFVFVIGGANGLSKDIIKKSHLNLSLSKMTLPHILVRIFLIEQLYRAQSIIANHPYHRS